MTLLKNAQLNFCKTQDIIAYTKASIISARNDARSDSVWSGILSATEANNVIDDPEFSLYLSEHNGHKQVIDNNW